jgi:hypothetical protein
MRCTLFPGNVIVGGLLFVVGLAVATGLGHVLVEWFLTWVRKKSGVPFKASGDQVPNWITGAFERLLAFVLVVTVSEFQQVALILLAWMGAKLAANWQRQPFRGDGSAADQRLRIYTISALMAGTLSLAIGIAGGEIARRGAECMSLVAPQAALLSED